MMGDSPMNRLIQGDVGSGKTAVAAALCYCVIQDGMQAALMAPTEVLARQHHKTLSALLEPAGIRTALLVGSMTPKQKREAVEGLASGEFQLAVGTHALLTDGVAFRKLGLVITDEQHRFGVAQRAALAQKGENPHLLVMSATPIPRTLALMIFGDLDISVLDELPPAGRKLRPSPLPATSASGLLGISASTWTGACRGTSSVLWWRRAKAIWPAWPNTGPCWKRAPLPATESVPFTGA